MRATIGPTILPFTLNSCDAWSYSFQRRSFYANGRHWIFYRDTPGSNGVWRSSIDGINWSGATVFRFVDYSVAFSTTFDGTYVHYVFEDGTGDALYYRRGIPEADGSITWSAAEQTVLAGVEGIRYYWVTIGVDSGGYPWIGYQRRGTVGDRYPYVTKSSTNDGTWATDGGFPHQLNNVADNGWIVIPLALTNNRMYIIYSESTGTLGKLWTGSWGGEEDSGARPYYPYTVSATTDGDDVLFLISEIVTDNLVFFRRTYGGGWGAGATIYSGNTWEHPILAYSSQGLYAFWLPRTANPTADHIFYRKSTDGGLTWTDEAGADANEDWIDESVTGFTTCPESLALYMHAAEGSSSYIGLAYTTNSPAPMDANFVILNADPSGSSDLGAGFTVKQWREALPAEFEIRQGFVDLPAAEFIVRQAESEDLPGELIVRQAESVDLLGELVVRHPDSEELAAEFSVRRSASEELLGEFIVRHPDLENLPAGFVIRRDSSTSLGARFNIRRSTSEELLGELTVRHSDSEDLAAQLVIRRSASQSLAAQFVVRHDGSQELAAQFIVRHPDSEELLGEFIVRHSASEELPGELIVRHTATPLIAAGFAVRQIYPLWTNRRIIDGVVPLNENLMGDAKLEVVIEGVMDDVRVWCDSEELSYATWTDINTVPRAMKRATTYGVVAALYARHSKTFQGRVIPTLAPVTVTVTGDDEKSMLHWVNKMETMLDLYLTAEEGARIWISTADEEPVFSMDDIPDAGTSRDLIDWREWL